MTKGRNRVIEWCGLFAWLLVAELLGGFGRAYVDFLNLVRGPLPTINNLLGLGVAHSVGLFALAGLQILWHFLWRMQHDGRIGAFSKRANHRLGIVQLSQSVVFVNVCLTVLAYALITFVRRNLTPDSLLRNWLCLGTLLGASVAVPWAMIALLLLMVTNNVRREDLKSHLTPRFVTAPLGPLVPIVLAISTVFRTYVILRYGFVLSCFYEMLIGAVVFSDSLSQCPAKRQGSPGDL